MSASSMTHKRDGLPLENMSSNINTKQQYNYYCRGWKAFLLNMSCSAPDFRNIVSDEGFTTKKNNLVDKAVSRLRKAWYDGYYDARTDARLAKVLGRRDCDLILITTKGNRH